MVTNLPPNSFTFKATPQATFPKPEIATVFPSIVSPLVFNIC